MKYVSFRHEYSDGNDVLTPVTELKLSILRNMKMARKLPAIMTLFVAVAIAVLSTANAILTEKSIRNASREKLSAVAYQTAEKVETLLRNIDRDITLRAAEPSTAIALIALSDGFASLENPTETLRRVYIEENPNPLGEKDLLVKADTGSSYGFIHAIYHPPLDTLQNAMNYYDVFLFDTEGNLVYSVFKENDFATNMNTGPWKDSGLAEVFRRANEAEAADGSAFVDFAPYAPSAMAPAAFIARPVFNEQGQRLGVLAFQMPTSELDGAVNELRGLGESADGFLIGPDGFLRTNSNKTPDNDALSKQIDVSEEKFGDAHLAALFEGAGLNGQPVIGYHVPIVFNGIEWISVVEQDVSEVMSGVRQAIWQSLILSGIVFAGALALSVVFSRSISAPVQRLSASVANVAGGDLSQPVPEQDRGDEIGGLARAAEGFRENAQKMEELNAQQQAQNTEMERLNADREKAAERERHAAQERKESDARSAQEREDMMRLLGSSFGDVVAAALNGEFSKRITAEFNDEVLIELAGHMNSLMEEVDANLSATSQLLSQIAEGDLSHRMEGHYKGAFSDLQQDVNRMVSSLTSLIRDISDNGTNLAGSSQELQQTSADLSRQAEQNAAAVEQTSATLEELSASLKQVNANVADVSDAAQQASGQANTSEAVAGEAASAMDRIADCTSEISRVTSVINDISFQINLLALNAGVEAARAGEAGRGFSVVASEVRQLAQRASDASREISDVITQSDQAVQEGVEKVASAKSQMEGIAKSVIQISKRVGDVTKAVAEQSHGVNEIATSVAQVGANTQKQAASFEEVTASSHVLANQAKDLQSTTTRFIVSEEERSSAVAASDANQMNSAA